MITPMTAQDVIDLYERAMARHLAVARRTMRQAWSRDNRYRDCSLHTVPDLQRTAREIRTYHQQMWDQYAARCRAIHGAPDPGPDPTWAVRTTGAAAEYRAFMMAEENANRLAVADWQDDLR